jgi:hypothetical protein
MPQASGINLSAFGMARRPMLATATLGEKGDARVELKPATAFAGKHKLSDGSVVLFGQWRGWLMELPRPIGVDVALDIDALGAGGNRRAPALRQLWELTHRPIDFAFYGDAPLTDKIGEFGVRFRAMLDNSVFELGNDILEVFPRATVEMLEFKGQYIGGAAHMSATGWKADDREKRGDKLMAKLLAELGVNAGQGAEKFDSDDLDAMLCALTALGAATGQGVLTGKDLDAEIAERTARRGNAAVDENQTAPSASAVLARPFWESLTVSK